MFSRKILVAAVAAASACMSGGVAAQATIGVNALGTGPGGGYAATNHWTHDTDTALALGFIPGQANYDIRLLAQTSISALSLGNNTILPQGLVPNVNFEITKVIDIQERVTAFTSPGAGLANANFGMTTQTADLDPNTAGLQQMAIYFDTNIADGSKRLKGDGTGTVACYGAGSTSTGCGNDGTLALSARLVNNTGSFSANASTGTGSFTLTWQVDYVNPLFLQFGVGALFGDIMTGTTNFPTLPGIQPAVMWNGIATNTGILLKVDGSQDFQAPLPEPGSLALLGLGLVGLGALFRRKAA